AGVRCYEADRGPEREPDRRRRERQPQDGPSAPEKAAQHVAAETVGPEKRLRRGMRVRQAREGGRLVWREEGSDDSRAGEQQDERDSDPRSAEAPGPADEQD